MREDKVGKAGDVVGDYIPVVKIERNASSVNEMPREAWKVSKVVCLREIGNARALACLADRQMQRRKEASTRREEDIVKGSRRKGGGKMLGSLAV